MSSTSTGSGWRNETSPEVLDANRAVIYILDADLKIVYCNPAWDAFALANGGERCTAARVLGTALLPRLIPEFQTFYSNVLGACRAESRVIAFDYECSSAEIYRTFQMQIFPFKTWDGVMVMNSLRVEKPAEAGLKQPRDNYVNERGMTILCSHCRRAKTANGDRWDWVPDLLEPSPTVSHGLCLVCRDYFYKLEIDLARSA